MVFAVIYVDSAVVTVETWSTFALIMGELVDAFGAVLAGIVSFRAERNLGFAEIS